MFLSLIDGVFLLMFGSALAGACAATLVLTNYWLSRLTAEERRQSRFRERIRARLNRRQRVQSPVGN